jgi:uncharacterized membrane protein YheB (UPF0754 family)
MIETTDLIRLTAIPIIAAATGYITNYIAVRMLFRPRTECRIFGLRLQGLIPRRRGEIADSIADTVAKHLISHDDIRQVLAEPAVEDQIRNVMDERIDHLLHSKLPAALPLLGAFLNEKVLGKIKASIMSELMDAVPVMTEQVMDTVEEHLDFRRIVVEKIEGFDLGTLEEIVLRIASKELRAIEILGGVMGFGIGLLTDLLLLI